MSVYSILLKILDQIRYEAPSKYRTYKPDSENIEKINQARAKAFIHLYLKSSFGIIDFIKRERYITDDTNDGGIDGYYIDNEIKKIYFIQSKFRTTESNFEEKKIKLEEILKMDIDRILNGEVKHENGILYNNKIKEMQKRISSISDIGRYSYEVIILANLPKITATKLRLLSSGLPCHVFDYKKTYFNLVFPIVTGTYYNQSDLNINVSLSNKSAGAKINYSVETKYGGCDITVLFVPTSEVGKLMYEYKNSILKYNPRSFLTLREGSINDEIRKTILEKDTNEFALFNNGITILSEETYFNEKIGQKDKVQLSLKNPQIINGGQTAFTLSLLYEEFILTNSELIKKLENKEVLVKVITFSSIKEIPIINKLELIESISEATNKQNQVNFADRSSNNPLLIKAQKSLFIDFGILLERKRGEFYDGIRFGYIDKQNLIDRGVFIRIAFASIMNPVPPKKEKQLFSQDRIDHLLNEKNNFRRYYFGCVCYSELLSLIDKSRFGKATNAGMFAVISICSTYYSNNIKEENVRDMAINTLNNVLAQWVSFEEYIVNQLHNSKHFNFNYNYKKNSYQLTENYRSYYRSMNLPVDINNFFFPNKAKVIENDNYRSKVISIDDFLKSNYLSPEIIKNVQSRINPNNWFDKETNAMISKEFDLDIKIVNTAVWSITSKDYGYYMQEYYK